MSDKIKLMVAAVPLTENVSPVPGIASEELKAFIEEAAAQNCDLLLLPQYIVGDCTQPCDQEKIRLLEAFASDRQCYVVYNCLETVEEKRYCASVILDRKGMEVGKYRKTHRVDGIDVTMDLGDSLPVFELDFGKVALLSGTDLYFPELAEAYSVLGAEILLCSMGVEPLRDDSQLQKLLKGRAVADYCFVAASTYASTKPMYMTNNYPLMHSEDEEAYSAESIAGAFNTNGLGLHTGRASVYDLRGELLASTGRESGVSACIVDLEKKRNILKYLYGTGRIITHQNKRGVFDELGGSFSWEPRRYPVEKPVVSLVHLKYSDTTGIPAKGPFENQDINYEKVFSHINRAAAVSDLVVCSELSAPGNRMTGEIMKKYADCARENSCYVMTNQEIDGINTSLIFDRRGQIVLRYEKVNTLNMMYENKLPAGTGLPVAELDFGTVCAMVCADSYCQEIPRLLALKGAEIIILQSQSWGFDSAAINEGVMRAWAIENCAFVIMSNFPSSQVVHRSNVIDPTGETVFATDYNKEGIYTFRIDLDAIRNKCCYEFDGNKVITGSGFREKLVNARRPELYKVLTSSGLPG